MKYLRITLMAAFACCILNVDAQSFFHKPDFNTELLSNVPFSENSSDIWGVEKDGIRYAVIGNRTKVSVFSLEDPKKPVLRYQAPGVPSIWRDIKYYNNHLYITADEGDGGITIIDMTNAPLAMTHSQFKPQLTLGTDVSKELLRCHNLYIDAKGFMYLAGCNISKRGVLIFDLNENPKSPKFSGAADLQYSHDAYVQGDTLYASEIYLGKISIYDVKDKAKPLLLGAQSTSRTFTHNAWASSDGRFVFTTDERQGGFVDAYDISDLNNIRLLDKFRPLERENDGVIPHNTHYHNGYLITSWYTDGLRIVDAHRPENLIEVAYYDTWEDQRICHNNFNGCWGAFPFTGSDIIYGSDIENGLYIVKVDYKRACYVEGKITDSNGIGISNAVVQIQSDQTNRELSGPTGDYKTGLAASGSFKVSISHPDYHPKEFMVNINHGVVTLLNVSLDKRVPVNIDLSTKSKNDQFLAAKVLFNGLNAQILQQTSGFANLTTTIPSGSYQVFSGLWGYKNAFLPDFSVSGTSNQPLKITLDSGYEDNFQTDLGWTVSNSSGVQGAWVRAIPKGTVSTNGFQANPDKDSDDHGNIAWVTGNTIPGAGCSDVDNGSTELKSPVFDLSSYTQPGLNYDAWFYSGNGSVPPDDTLIIKLTNGINEVTVEKIHQSTISWNKSRGIDIKKIIQPTANMQLKVIASDQNGANAHIVEAGFDNFFINELSISSTNENEILSDNIIIKPNPANDQIKITIPDFQKSVHYFITDIYGRIVTNGTLTGEDTGVESIFWPTGIYFIKADGYRPKKVIKL